MPQDPAHPARKAPAPSVAEVNAWLADRDAAAKSFEAVLKKEEKRISEAGMKEGSEEWMNHMLDFGQGEELKRLSPAAAASEAKEVERLKRKFPRLAAECDDKAAAGQTGYNSTMHRFVGMPDWAIAGFEQAASQRHVMKVAGSGALGRCCRGCWPTRTRSRHCCRPC